MLNQALRVSTILALIVLVFSPFFAFSDEAKVFNAALANTMNSVITPAEIEMPMNPFNENLDKLVTSAYWFNPDRSKVEAGLKAADGALRTAKKGYYPKLALTGERFRW